jgi:light-regulated signal transduction histidine kinase (bacteriophytochrome)
MSNLIFKNEECKVATFRDVTELKKLAKIEADNKLLQLLTSSVTHEMVTPLKCIVNFSESLVKELRNSPKKHEAELIMTTSKLLLA